jgi:hypothetical protein
MMRKIFATLPASGRMLCHQGTWNRKEQQTNLLKPDINSLDKLVSKSIYNAGYMRTPFPHTPIRLMAGTLTRGLTHPRHTADDSDVQKIEGDMDTNGFVYDSKCSAPQIGTIP